MGDWVRLNLSDFFSDDRKFARIKIKPNMQKMKDLYDRISHVFGVNNFILTNCDDYIPASEDIDILEKNHTINVINIGESYLTPSSDDVKNTLQLSKEVFKTPKIPPPQQLQKAHQVNSRINNTSSSEISAVNYNRGEADGTDTIIIPNAHNDNPQRQNQLANSVQNLNEHSSSYDNRTTTVDNAINNSNINPKTYMTKVKIKVDGKRGHSKTRRQIDTSTNLSNQQINNQSNIDRITQVNNESNTTSSSSIANQTETPTTSTISNREPTETNDNAMDLVVSARRDIITFSNHVNSSSCRHFKPPERITKEYLSNRKINIVKVDIISPARKNCVKEKIPVNENHIELNNSVKEIVDDTNEAANLEDNEQEVATANNSFNNNIEMQESSINDCSTITIDTDDSQQFTSDTSLTKRKRTRKRKHKRKHSQPSEEELIKLKPFKSKFLENSKPALHVKFSDNEDCKSETNNKTENAEPLDKSEICNNLKNEEEIKENYVRHPVSELSPTTNDLDFKHTDNEPNNINWDEPPDWTKIFLKKTLMPIDMQPETNDIIGFRVLKMGNNYNPELSNVIIGKVVKYSPTEENISFLILAGHSELDEPIGKFSMPSSTVNTSTDVSKKMVLEDFIWSSLTEKKLLKR